MKPVKFESDAEYLESILIATVLAYPDTYPEVAGIVKLTYFQSASAMHCWGAIGEHWAKANGDSAELKACVYMALPSKTVKQWFFDVTTGTIPIPATAKTTAARIADAAKCRRISAGMLAVAEKSKVPGNTSEMLLYNLAEIYRKETGNADEDVSIGAALDRLDKIQEENLQRGCIGRRTGFDMFQRDDIVYQPGHLWVIGAWTSVGKTAFMIEAINRFLEINKSSKTLIFSTEMTEEQNLCRLLANKTGVGAKVILSGNMFEQHRKKVDAYAAWLRQRDVHIYSKTSSIDEIMAQCRKHNLDGDLDMVWIDFIQNVYRHGARDQYTMMSTIARDLQALAHELECTILCLSQLPNHAGREDTGILEYKGAGEIAAACDVGVLMNRAKEDKSKLLFEIRKNRHGKCEQYLMQFADGWTRIEEVSRAE